MVIMLAIGPKVCGSNLDKSSGILRAINICSMTSFGGKIKPWAPCFKIMAC
jgi:hypothetical protein